MDPKRFWCRLILDGHEPNLFLDLMGSNFLGYPKIFSIMFCFCHSYHRNSCVWVYPMIPNKIRYGPGYNRWTDWAPWYILCFFFFFFCHTGDIYYVEDLFLLFFDMHKYLQVKNSQWKMSSSSVIRMGWWQRF